MPFIYSNPVPDEPRNDEIVGELVTEVEEVVTKILAEEKFEYEDILKIMARRRLW